MTTKALAYAQLADQTARRITGSHREWTAYLDTAARLYKYPYHDQLLIYAQRPDATACAEYDLWNTVMHRYVRRGSKGIALLDASADFPRLRYVFDVADTGGGAHARMPVLWALGEEHIPGVSAMLEDSYAVPADSLPAQLTRIAEQEADAYWTEHQADILGILDAADITAYDEAAAGVSFRQTAAASIAYLLQARCGLHPEERFDQEDFLFLTSWNTPPAAAALGSAVSRIGQQVLRQIERTVKAFDRTYSAERTADHERNDLYPERRLPDPQHYPDGAGERAPQQVRTDAESVSPGAEAGTVEQPASERQTVQPSAGDRPERPSAAESADDRADRRSGRDGEAEGIRPADLGGGDEHTESSGGRNDSRGADLRLTGDSQQLSLFASETEQIQAIYEAESLDQRPFAFSYPAEVLDTMLQLGGNTEQHRLAVIALFAKQLPMDEIAARLPEIYRGGSGYTIRGQKYSAWYDEAGIRISSGTAARYDSFAQQIAWADAARRIGEMLDEGTFAPSLELAAALPHERQQLAESLVYLRGDLSEEAHQQGYLSMMDDLGRASHADTVASVDALLADAETREVLTEQLRTFRMAYRENRDLLRFHSHRVGRIMARLEELRLPRRSFSSRIADVPDLPGHITEDEISLMFTESHFENGKSNISAYFGQTHTEKEKAGFLWHLYGIGGRVPGIMGERGTAEEHNSKGIALRKKGCPDIRMKWSQAVKRIETLIRLDRYLTADEKEERNALREMHDEPATMQGEALQKEVEPEAVPETVQVLDVVESPEEQRSSPYLVVAYHHFENGFDAKLDYATLEEAEAAAQGYVDGTMEADGFRYDGAAIYDQQEKQYLQVYGDFPDPKAIEQASAVLPAQETAAMAEESLLPYDIVLEKIPAEPAQLPAPAAENFRITDDNLGAGGAKAKYAGNMAAIRTLKAIEQEGRSATPEEQEILSRYVGWGGLPQAFDSGHAAWASEAAELQSLLTPDEYDKARASTLNAHYTSPTVIKAIYEAVGRMGFQTGNILEPAMGVGNFFGLLPEAMRGSRLYGVELDSITGRIARQLYPKADITVAGFETTNRTNFFDLAVGNVPFGAYQVADRQYDKYNFQIHDYFFAKAIDQLRPGGVLALITSKGTMDKQNPEIRRYLAQRAELLGAIRLPSNAFKANAGTEVTSDILFLQKRERPIEVDADWIHLGQTEDGIPINSYFAAHPEMMLGKMTWWSNMYGSEKETSCQPFEGANLSDQLHEAIRGIRGTYQAAELPELPEGEPAETIPADPAVRNYSFCIVDGQVYYRTNSVMVRPDLSQTAQERVKGLIALRDSTRALIDAQMENAEDDAIHALQEELSRQYDSFTAKHGLINARSNAQAFSDDSSYYLLCSLEVLDEEGGLKRKADIFSRRTIRPPQVVEHADTAAEALAVSISERAQVDLSYMAQLTGKTEEALAKELTGVIFRLPSSPADHPDYVTADEYLSGNVRQKLRIARQAAESDASFAPNVEALQAAQPKDLDASEIDVRLGATWVDKAYIQQFMHELLSTPRYLRSEITVHFSTHTAEWRINGKGMVGDENVAAYVTYGTRRTNAYHILEDTLNLRDVRVYDTVTDPDGTERRVLNQKETTLAQQKQQAIKDAFGDWVWKDASRRQALVSQYNELFNSSRPRTYDGQHITFSGMSPDIILREHQRNAVAHILYGGNTLLAHEVGAGKTFEMVAAAMESKRLGLCSKCMFVVPNHLTEQWASEFLRLYPAANILVTTKKDFEKHNRKKFCARIATGDYDAIIIGHSQFERIPISQARQEQLIHDQINDITDGIAELKAAHAERFTIKQLERSKKQLETRLAKLQKEERKDDVVTFEELGVDRLYVDEAHLYKNLFLYTKMRNVAGLSTSEAQKSADMFLKCRYMDEITGGRGIVFATGTPVSNSMTELYTMQRYLQYDTLQRKGLTHFDAWASTFGETVTAIELAPEGTGYRARTRFAHFFNLPELMNLFREVADIKTADQLHLPTPEAHFETVVVKPSAHQQEMVQALSERAAAVHGGAVDPHTDNMLKITSDGRKLGLDQRLINPLLPDDPASKVNACVNNIFRIWQEGQREKLTQLVFCDMSTPKSAGAAMIESASSETGEAASAAVSIAAPDQFSVYDDIRAKLIARGVPAEEIAFIHTANTEVRKKELFGKVRSGQVRVLMGSTAKMGAGTNCQDRLIALHDLDCPWRPGDLEQRAGRIVRQGNMNKEVHIFRYVTEGTFDGYLWVRHEVA